jgi:hypothetical protein
VGDALFLFWGEQGMMWWGLPVLYFGTLVVKCMAIMICGTVLEGLVCGWHSGGWCSGDSVCDIMVFVASNLAV